MTTRAPVLSIFETSKFTNFNQDIKKKIKLFYSMIIDPLVSSIFKTSKFNNVIIIQSLKRKSMLSWEKKKTEETNDKLFLLFNDNSCSRFVNF